MMDTSYYKKICSSIVNKNFALAINLICNDIDPADQNHVINSLILARDLLNDPTLFVKHFSQPIIKNALNTNSSQIIQFFINDYGHILDPDEMGDLLWNACITYGLRKSIVLLLTEYKYFESTIISRLFKKSIDSDLIAILLDNFHYKIPTKIKIEKLLEALGTPNLALLNILLTDIIIKKRIIESTHQIYDLIQPNLIKQPEIFKPLLETLMKIKGFAQEVEKLKSRIASLYLSISPHKIHFGPPEKDLYTQELEYITKYTLRNPQQTYFFIHDNHIIGKLTDIKVDVSKLINQADLSHIFLNAEDSAFYKSLSSFSMKDLETINCTLPANYTLKNTSLEYAERLCIFDYTDSAYEMINSTLHEKLANTLNTPTAIRDNFLKIIFLASGLNKIYPSWTRDPEVSNSNLFSYRGEKHLTSDELNQRISRLLNSKEVIIQKQSGFFSTSSNLNKVEFFENGISRIQYAELYGKNIRPLSKHPTENEYLQLPGYIQLESYQKNANLTIFKAKVLTPLYKKNRSVQQECRFKKLLALDSENIIIKKNPFVTFTSPLLLEGLLEECQFVYEHYLSKPFTEIWLDIDWELVTPFGIIPRPNHGLAHVMRVAHLVPVVAEFLRQYDANGCFSFTHREINIIQLTALFSVVGRKNEAAFNDAYVKNLGYKAYKKTSYEAFIDYTSRLEFLDMTKTEIELYSKNIKKMGNPKNFSSSGILLTLAHKLDLLRCYDSSQRVQESIVQPLTKFLPKSEIETLLNYAEALLHATGNRVAQGKKICGYTPDLFYLASTKVEACYNAICSITPPIPQALIKGKIANNETSYTDFYEITLSNKK